MKAFEKPKTIEGDTFYPSISNRKGVAGGVEGAVASVVGIGITAIVKTMITDIDPSTENTIAGVSGIIASGLLLGITKLFRNRWKHSKKS